MTVADVGFTLNFCSGWSSVVGVGYEIFWLLSLTCLENFQNCCRRFWKFCSTVEILAWNLWTGFRLYLREFSKLLSTILEILVGARDIGTGFTEGFSLTASKIFKIVVDDFENSGWYLRYWHGIYGRVFM